MQNLAILREVAQLNGVGDRLDGLTAQHPVISEALLGIAGSVRNTAALLEVVVATKLPPMSGPEAAND
jgi:hypothetical protein